MMITLFPSASLLLLLLCAESPRLYPPPLPSTNTNAPTPGSNPAVVMSAVWDLCYDGYVITSAYLLVDSPGVRITCFPHVQSIVHPSSDECPSSHELEKRDVSISELFPGNSIFLRHTHSPSLSLLIFLTISYNLPQPQ